MVILPNPGIFCNANTYNKSDSSNIVGSLILHKIVKLNVVNNS